MSAFRFHTGKHHGIDGEPRLDGVLVGHRMAVTCLAVSGRVVASGSADRTLSCGVYYYNSRLFEALKKFMRRV